MDLESSTKRLSFFLYFSTESVFQSRHLLSTVEWETCNFEIGHERNYSNRESWTAPRKAYAWLALHIFLILVIFVGKWGCHCHNLGNVLRKNRTFEIYRWCMRRVSTLLFFIMTYYSIKTGIKINLFENHRWILARPSTNELCNRLRTPVKPFGLVSKWCFCSCHCSII